jgi:diguanylate cyclase (GGDEF)-like protein
MVPARLGPPILLVVAVVVIAAAVWVSSYAQRTAAHRVADQSRAAQILLTAMLDQETGTRGYLLNGRIEFLQPFQTGQHDFVAGMARARAASRGDREIARLLDAQEVASKQWLELADEAIARAQGRGREVFSLPKAILRKTYMDRFRELNGDLQAVIDRRRRTQLRDAGLVAVAVVIGLSVMFTWFGALLIRRANRVRRREQEFTEALPVMRSETEAHELLRAHLERSVGDSHVTVLTRNNSRDRIHASTSLEDTDPLKEPLEHAGPDTCLAVRLARPHERDRGSTPLIECELCGKTTGSSVCQPLLVGGEVLGSVLLRKPACPTRDESAYVSDAVARAAPALANLRNLAVAETRAQTDPLTNLANRRAISETVKRLHAHAMRTGSALSVVVADLDHFKRINDTYGHDRGDDALAATAEALVAAVRTSDFVGRMGGEEFVVLLPDTGAEAAVRVAEKLRVAIRALRLTGIQGGLSASFGVSTFPKDAVESDGLLQLADRALYMAKKLGRDRVESAGGDDPIELQQLADRSSTGA